MKKAFSLIVISLIVLQGVFASGVAEQSTKVDEGTTVLKVMHFMGEETKRSGLNTWCDEFKKTHPGVEFEIEAVPYSQYGQQLQTKIAAGDAPDIMGGAPKDWNQFVTGGHIEDMSNQPFLANIPEEFKEIMTIDGKVYGLPVDYSIKGVFYNRDMFEEYGLEVPRTYTDFVKVMDTFADAGQVPFARPFKDNNAPETDFKASFNVVLAKQNPTMWKQIQNKEKHITDFPIFEEELTKYVQRMNYISLDDYANDGSRALQMFAAGKAPMMINGAWISGDLCSMAPEGNFGCFPVCWSENEADNQYEIKADDAFMVSASSQNKELALEFVNYVGSNEGGEIWMEKARLIPTNKNIKVSSDMPVLLQELSSNLNKGMGCSSGNIYELTGEPKAVYRQSLHALVGNKNMKNDIPGFIAQLDKDLTTALAK